MTTDLTSPPPALLPILLALPTGSVVGIPSRLLRRSPRCERELAAFGPCITSEPQLRHAVSRSPARLVVEVESLPGPLVGAALAVLGGAGAVVAVVAGDTGRLLRLCDRLLEADGAAWRWVGAARLLGLQSLELRIVGAVEAGASSVSIALGGGAHPEGVLAGLRAGGIAVRGRRITYRDSPAR